MSEITRIAFAPLLPWPAIAVLAAAAAALLAFALWRRADGTWWRALALAAGLAALVNPALVREQRSPLTDVAVVVVDQSISQRIGERRQRSEAALRQIEAELRERPDLDLRVIRAGRGAGGGRLLPDGTHLMGALRRAFNDVPARRVAGAVIISDGQVHDLPKDAAKADPGGPVHLLLSGDRDERDRRLVVLKSPSYGIVGEPLALTVMVEDSTGNAARASLRIRQDGGPVEQHRVGIGKARRIPFRLHHAGATVLEMEVDAGPDELTLKNNRAVLIVNGVRERLRVLLVSGEPHAGERTWRNILKSDPSVDLVHFTILRPPHKQDGTPIEELSLISFPTRELFQVKLADFDLIIFDRYRRRGVLPDVYLRNVADYVREGGAVLTAAGPAFATPLSLFRTPLAEVLPSRPTGDLLAVGYRPIATRKGRRHPVTAELPGLGAAGGQPEWGRWFRLIDVRETRGDTLMRGAGERPLLILDRVGEGRVAQLLSDHAWLWTRGFEGGGPQAEMLRRIAHWLMKEPDLEEDDLRARGIGNRLSIQRRSLSANGKPVKVTLPSGETTEVGLTDNGRGTETGELAVEEPGLYRLADDDRRAVAAVGDINPREYADMRASDAPLRPLLKLTGGGAYWLADGMPDIRRVKADRMARGRGWLGLRANGDYTVTGVERTPLLPALLVLALFLGVTMLAWYREGR